ncbi:MAG: hypothetical protein LAN64_19600, partial [Acidobacteriia bacterium]|nr:hypothetical protein [Terriglobia bacterium]
MRNLVATGTLSGLSEAVMLRGMGAGAMIARAAHINWLKAIDGILLSHIYFGGWSSLTARSWMYHVFYLMIAAAAVGLARGRRTGLEPAATFYAFFWIGQMYNVVLLYLSKGVAVSMGWYLYAVIGAEIAVCAAGLRLWRRVLAAGVVLLGLLDFYTVHALAMPYYAGIVAHKANGGIAGLHRADPRVFAQVFS